MKRTELQRRTPMKRTPLKRTAPKRRRRAVSPASSEQRAKVRDRDSITGKQGPCDPAHIVSRALGGCDDALCVIPLTRGEHRDYDQGKLDLAPYLIGSHVPELQHALEHTNGSLTRLLHVLTGQRWTPIELDREELAA